MIQFHGDLFEAVQKAGIYSDSKTFVDSIPRRKEEDILKDYREKSKKPEFVLKNFIEENFEIASPVQSSADKIDTTSMESYIDSLWPILKREPDEKIEGDSRIPLPFSYIVPGGRFREIYYWDTYFTCEGLAVAGKYDMIEDMLKNFVYLQKTVGLIPNGTRWYFQTRSQPPVLGLMVDLLYQKFGVDYIKPYLSALEREVEIWSSKEKWVLLPDGSHLSRYYDKGDWPREEAFKEDTALAAGLPEEQSKTMYRHLRSGAESGWDFSSRWLKDSSKLETICTTEIIPVCLNGLVYSLEFLLSKYHQELGNLEKAKKYEVLAKNRQKALDAYCWNEEKGGYFDYNFIEKKQTDVISMAMAVPLFVKMASEKQAKNVATLLKNELLKEGGFSSTVIESGQQWDSPNGWAPLQWFGVKGLLNYGFNELAVDAAQRWVKTMRENFSQSKCLLEKYNVINPLGYVGGGEYGVQEGFGWTNGIALKFFELFSLGAAMAGTINK